VFTTHIQAFALSFLFGRLQNSLSILHAFWYPETLEDSFRLLIAALPPVPAISFSKNVGRMSVPDAKAACLINELVVANAFSKG
jgi:hypothetical protein